MKILHTSDWHIGKKLHGFDLSPELGLFFDWLLTYIETVSIDVLLVSGDIFDYANPSNEAKRMYYDVLKRLIRLNCRVVITGGNHDSPLELNAPKEILALLDITVIGRLPVEMNDRLVPILNKKTNKVAAVIVAIPFIRDADLRNTVKEGDQSAYEEQIKMGISAVFHDTATYASEQFPNVPLLAMGHLYATGVATSDSERVVQLGNMAGVNATHLSDQYDYIALGHIHKPQIVGGKSHIVYAGSPVSLSFSERKDQKRVMVLQISDDGTLSYESVPIPKFRDLRQINGSLEEIRTTLEAYLPVDSQYQDLPTLLEINLIDEHYNPTTVLDFQQLCRSFESPHAIICKSKITFQNQLGGVELLSQIEEQEGELNPVAVFHQLLAQKEVGEDDHQLIMEAFHELYQQLQQDQL